VGDISILLEWYETRKQTNDNADRETRVDVFWIAGIKGCLI
jgi:hypothetical protein|tara:strand:- start:482 stop:604 length:123 start_codon:yes stop_codon:yes gene_type:complete